MCRRTEMDSQTGMKEDGQSQRVKRTDQYRQTKVRDRQRRRGYGVSS